jgi:hypothetical protein
MESSHSGLVRHLGKVVRVKALRGFESLTLRKHMKKKFTGQYKENIRVMMQKCGYAFVPSRTGEAYARRLGRGEFPRFHVYIKQEVDRYLINLHLDQKSACYSGTSAHSGEYDGGLVEDEIGRIGRWFAHFQKGIE